MKNEEDNFPKAFSFIFMIVVAYLILFVSAILLGTTPYWVALPVAIVMMVTWFYFINKLYFAGDNNV